jgi:hypothetical protein
MNSRSFSRRSVLKSAALALVSPTLGAVGRAAGPKSPQQTIRLFNCDFNWARWPDGRTRPSLPEDWGEVDAKKYFDWHREFGNNVVYCQAYCSSGYALYPSKLGPLGKGKAQRLLPDLFELAKKAALPFWSYFCVAGDLMMSREHPEWLVPGSQAESYGHGGFFGPETPRTKLLCARIREVLSQYPVDWLLLDWFVYGTLKPDEALVQPAEFVKQPFQELLGRPMPGRANEITPKEHLEYKRSVLARQFRALRDAVRETSPRTKVIFNVPYHKPNEALWREHPMLLESDGLFAESSDDVVGWLLSVRKPQQRVMTTIIGRGGGLSVPGTWRKWHERGCDFFGYAWGAPPDFRPVPMYHKEMEVVRAAFAEIAGTKAADRPLK